MKKAVVIICVVLVAFFCIFSSLYVVDHIRMQNNESVIFSTWGKQYVPSVGITPEKAVEYTKQMIDDKSKESIKDINNPKIENIVFNKTPSIYFFEEKSDIVGRRLYRVIYNTEQDGLLGPIAFYVDKLDGTIIGMDYRG